jgi:outer membrane protein assembly factor BamE (lipoprotein component of BamABCDE complex)
MYRNFLCITLILFLNSCSPIIKTHGYTIEDTAKFTDFITEIVEKEQTSKEEISTNLGSPSIIIDNVDNIWIYLFSTKEEKSFSDSEIKSQFIIKLTFDNNDNLISNQTLTGEDLNQISFSSDTTISPINNYGVTEQLIDTLTRSNSSVK